MSQKSADGENLLIFARCGANCTIHKNLHIHFLQVVTETAKFLR